MLHRLIVILAICSAGFSGILQGQTITVKASKNKVAEGEQFQLTYIVEGSLSDFKEPSLKDFIKLSGPNQSTSVQIINGTMSQTMSIYYFLAARKEGLYTIGPASATVNGKKTESPSIKIEVEEGNLGQSYNGNNYSQQQQVNPPNNTYGNNRQNYNRNSQEQNAAAAQPPSKDYFIRYSVDKTKAYVGEQIALSIKLYTRVEVRGPDDFSFPALDGFWKYDVPKTSQIKRSKETIDGVSYTVYVIFENFLFPQKSGTLTIDPASIKCRVLQPRPSSGNWWEDFMNSGMAQEVSVSLKTQKLEFDIQTLPEENKPVDFSGAVGQYTMKTEISREQLRTDEALNIKLTVSGNGNLKLMDAPRMEIPEQLELLEVKTTENVGVSSIGVSGSKVFDYPVVARMEGNSVVPATSFNYFDPEKKEYVALPTPDFKIKVEPGKAAEGPQVNNYNTPKQEVQVKEDIRHIKTGAVELAATSPVFGSPGFIIALILPALLFILLLVLKRRREKAQADVEGTRRRMAGKSAKQHLAAAEQSLKTAKHDTFYEEVLRAVHGYLTDKLQMQTGDFSHERIREALLERNAKNETIHALLEVVSACEYARYAPPAESNSPQQTFDKATACIETLESEIS
ncbi:MAG: hypothetical protein FD123_2517 [Bacteroidetes bacterium]|nr:MAG: hypothetical protein FD123_2517 [Bacteroidota bacterium]